MYSGIHSNVYSNDLFGHVSTNRAKMYKASTTVQLIAAIIAGLAVFIALFMFIAFNLIDPNPSDIVCSPTESLRLCRQVRM